MTKLFIPNFTIYATVPDGEFTIDPDTGNYVSNQTILEIKARMQGTPATEKKEDPSVDFLAINLITQS
ncbi:MAG: hypothetical protein ACKPE1_14180 [Dolichospermum sp.]